MQDSRSSWLRGDILFPATLLLSSIISITTILSLPPRAQNIHTEAEVVLRVFLFGFCGIGGSIAGLIHLIKEREIAEGIGWPAGNPFHYEVGIANLAIGMTGLLSRFIHGEFWTAVAISSSIFMFGAGIVHVVDLLKRKNKAELNSGFILLVDFLVPIILIGALLVYKNT